jgi:hypothetical protein
MSTPSGTASLKRWLVAWVVVFLSILSGVRVGFAADPDPAPAPAPATEQASPTYRSPADQPRATGPDLKLPAIPASFNTRDAGWIHFAYPPSTRERVEPLIRDADKIRAELAVRLGQQVLRKVHVRIARTPGEMTTLAPEGAPYPKYAAGVAYSEIGLILLTLTPVHPNALDDVGEVFRHELAHVALGDAVGDSRRVPYWFNEGLAVHLSGESSLLRLRTLWAATLSGRLIPLERLDANFPADAIAADLAYAESADVVRFLLRQQERERFPRLIERVHDGESFQAALRDAYGLDFVSLEYEWREEIARKYSFWPVLFSGTIVWLGVLALFVIAWQKRRRKSKRTLEQWAKEEARVEQGAAAAMAPRVHIVLPGQQAAEAPELPAIANAPIEAEVPKVEHEGQWHTLH